MKRKLVLLFTLFAFASLLAAADLKLDVKEHVLSNGMKILMIPRPGVPRVVCHIYFKVGSINEREGITGIAHIHEHMMFKGTHVVGVSDFAKDTEIDKKIDAVMDKIYHEKFWKADGGDKAKIAGWQKEFEELTKAEKAYIVKDELDNLYANNGGTGVNASTGGENTGYYVTMPSNKVELQMFVESDRLMNAYFREFYSEKDVIMEERRLSENRPGFFFSEQVNAAFYSASGYHWDTIGWMDDIQKITKADLIEFHNKYYVPNNAVAIYVGDFDPQALAAMAEKYFGRIPRGPDIEPLRTAEPPQYGEKRLYGESSAPTSLSMMFHTPQAGQPDAAPLQVLASILGGGGGGMRGGLGPDGGEIGQRGGGFGGGAGTGRLNKILVQEKQLAVNVSASSRAQWFVGAFQFGATPRLDKNVQPEDLEKEIWVEIDKVKKDGVTPDEIQKAKNRFEAQFIRSLSSSTGLAGSVGRAELHRGWRSLITDLDDLKKVTNDDIKRVAAKYFVKDNSLTAINRRGSGR
ncbi:MAG: pitrilysin family protein [Candidatus Aminicenantales bacterium]